MSQPSTFRAQLKRRRAERGLTQEALGELVGYAAQTIRKIESGQRRPSPQLALKLAQVLELGPDEQSDWMSAARAAEPDEVAAPPQSFRAPTPSLGLPTYLTPFVGRAQEQTDLAALLKRPDCRLITVLGPGGVGKTRLAIETGRTIQGFNDGAAFVSLAPVAAPALIVPAIGDALGFAFSGAGDLLAQLTSHLRDRRVLLILDNLEHLLDPAGVTLGLLEHLLTQAPGVSVLATSRERLRLAGEWVLELEGLPAPQLHAPMQPDAAPALTLFVEHAERVDRAFILTPTNEGAIITICRLVDGLPLGIELAAAWTRLLSLEEIAQELARGLDTAHLSPRTLPSRHHSLRSVVEHSWQLLSVEERESLRRLSVFQGGFTREAAAHVAGAELPVLASLADKSLLRRGGNKRYDLHEIIRQYADGRLQEHADELAATRNRHAIYFLRLVGDREHRIKGAEQAAATAEINAEIDNIRAAWSWAAAHGLLDELEYAGEALQWFYEYRSLFQEGVEFFARAVERLRAAGAGGDEAAWQRTFGRMLGHYGYLAIRFGAIAQAQTALIESATLLAGERDPVGLSRTLVSQASVAHWTGDYTAARRLLDQNLHLTTATGDRHVRARTLTYASNVAHTVGAYEEAERLFRDALATWSELGNPRGIVWCITSCSVTLLALGKYQEAQQLLRECLTLSHTTDDRGGTAPTVYYLGLVAFQQGELEEAVSLFREAVTTTLQAQAHHDALRLMIGFATHISRHGHHAAALRLATRVLVDPVSSENARRGAAELQNIAHNHLANDEAAWIEQQARVQSLTDVLAELSLPDMRQ